MGSVSNNSGEWSFVEESDKEDDWSLVTNNNNNNKKHVGEDVSSCSTDVGMSLPSDLSSLCPFWGPEDDHEILPYWDDDYSARKFPRKNGGKRRLKPSLVKRIGYSYGISPQDEYISVEIPRVRYKYPYSWFPFSQGAKLRALVGRELATVADSVAIDWDSVAQEVSQDEYYPKEPLECQEYWCRLNRQCKTEVDDLLPHFSASWSSATVGRSCRWEEVEGLFVQLEKEGVVTKVTRPRSCRRCGLGRYDDAPVDEVCYSLKAKNPPKLKGTHLMGYEGEDQVEYILHRHRHKGDGTDSVWRRYAVKEGRSDRWGWRGYSKNKKKNRKSEKDFSRKCKESYNR